jgi:lysozyme
MIEKKLNHDGKRVKPGDKLASEAQADALFRNTLGQYESAVNEQVKVPLTQNQFDALVSFCYNEGTGALKESTLLAVLNERKYTEAAAHFLAWDKITDPRTGEKVVCDTLVHRRKEESRLFLS